VADHEKAEVTTHAKHQKPVLVNGMRVVKELNGVRVKEDCLRFLKRNSVLGGVQPRLPVAPGEGDVIHTQ
jgi:hypothetical protein